MIKANELRIGNLVKINNPKHRKKDTDKTFHILKIDSENDSCNGVCIDDMPYAECFGQFLKYIEPIPLSEEWLIKYGFEKKTGVFIKIVNKQVIAFGLDGSYGLYNDESRWRIGSSFCGSNKIIFIHQLQNLYFTLTGEELTIKEL